MPDEITLDYDIIKGLIYTGQEHKQWEGFISIVNKRIKYHPLKYRAWGLYKKIEETVEICESFPSKISTIFVDKLKKEDLKFVILNDIMEEPSADYVDPEGVTFCIINGHIPLNEDIAKDKRYMFSCPGRRSIAKTTSESTTINTWYY